MGIMVVVQRNRKGRPAQKYINRNSGHTNDQKPKCPNKAKVQFESKFRFCPKNTNECELIATLQKISKISWLNFKVFSLIKKNSWLKKFTIAWKSNIFVCDFRISISWLKKSEKLRPKIFPRFGAKILFVDRKNNRKTNKQQAAFVSPPIRFVSAIPPVQLCRGILYSLK